jgi:hypothetical protein
MSSDTAGFPVQEVQFTKDGSIFDLAEVQELQSMIADSGVTDLLVMSHGWNNNMDEARGLYRDWLTALAVAPAKAQWPTDRKVGCLAVLWPSKKFDIPDETAGGAAALGDDHPQLTDQIEQLHDLGADDVIAALQQLAPSLEDDADKRTQFVRTVVGLLGGASALDDESSAEIPSELFRADGDLLERLGTDLPVAQVDDGVDPEDRGGAADVADADDPAGGPAGIKQFFGGIVSGARNLLNYVTFYMMKARAGEVGSKGLASVLDTVRPSVQRVHMVGHSFGCRLNSASLLGSPGVAPPTVSSMLLLQAAFSHNGFGKNYDNNGSNGFFRPVVDPRHVVGPIVVSFSEHDTAVGIAYPLASRIANQAAAALGDASDPFGGMGRNGAQHTPEAKFTEMLAVGAGSYEDLASEVVLNVHAASYIHSHSDVRGPEIAETLAQTIAAT